MDRTPRFYFHRDNCFQDKIIINDDQVGHITKSLRLNIGDKVILFDGKDTKYLSEIVDLTRREVTTKVIEELELNVSNVKIDIAQSIPKSKKLDEIIKKLTEIGINTIIPIESQYSEKKGNDILKKYDRFESIIINACKQSERDIITKLSEPTKIHEILNATGYDLKIIASAKGDIKKLSEVLDSKYNINNVLYLIGPEGGFSKEEISLAVKNGFVQVKINDNILRTETAAIYLGSILKYKFGL